MKVTCKIKTGQLSLGSLGICLVPDQVVQLTNEKIANIDVREAIKNKLLELENNILEDNMIYLINNTENVISLESIRATISPKHRFLTTEVSLNNKEVANAIAMKLLSVEKCSPPKQEIKEEIKQEEVKKDEPKQEIKEEIKQEEVKKDEVEQDEPKQEIKRKRGRPKKNSTVCTFGNTESVQNILSK